MLEDIAAGKAIIGTCVPMQDFLPVDGKRRKCYASRPQVARAMGLVPKRADATKQVICRKLRLRSADCHKTTKGESYFLCTNHLQSKHGTRMHVTAEQSATATCTNAHLPHIPGVVVHESSNTCGSCIEPGKCLPCDVLSVGGALKPALHLSQIVCQDSTRACIDEMLKKDKDLETACDELHAMRGTLAASEAARGQLETEVLQTPSM